MFVLDGPQRVFTRDGAFQLNSQNDMVSADGRYVMGYGVDKDFNIIPGQLQRVQVPVGSLTIAQATSKMSVGGALLTTGDLATAGTVLTSQAMQLAGGGAVTGATDLVNLQNANGQQMFNVGDTVSFVGQRSGSTLPTLQMTITNTTTVDDLMNAMVGKFGIDTDPNIPNPGGSTVVDLGSGQYAMQITGNVGAADTLAVKSFNSDSQTGVGVPTFSQTQAAVGESVNFSQTAYDSLGNPVQLSLTYTYDSKNIDGGTSWRFFATSTDNQDPSALVGEGTVDFDANGNFISSVGGNATINRAGTGALTPLSINIDMSALQALNTGQNSHVQLQGQDGFQAGVLDSYSVSQDGSITGSFSNGLTRTLGQVALATFGNYSGLVDNGNNTFIPGPDSGEAIVGAPLTSGAGSITDGALETSNVDISTEFVNLITTSAGFEASSRVVTTANTLLTDLLSIMR